MRFLSLTILLSYPPKAISLTPHELYLNTLHILFNTETVQKLSPNSVQGMALVRLWYRLDKIMVVGLKRIQVNRSVERAFLKHMDNYAEKSVNE